MLLSLSLSLYLFISIHPSVYTGGLPVSLCVLQRSLVNDWTPTGGPWARPTSVTSRLHWLLSEQSFVKAANSSCSLCAKPRPSALKEPPCPQWSLSPLTDLFSLSALSPVLLSILSYLLFSLLLSSGFYSSSSSLSALCLYLRFLFLCHY